MFTKIFAIVVIVALVEAQSGGGGGGGYGHGHATSYNTYTQHHDGHEQEIVYHGHPKYAYKYGVEDTHTHDKKSQHESRDGKHTQGEYSVVEPDGTVLTVHYSVEGKSGYNAVVSRHGHASHPVHH